MAKAPPFVKKAAAKGAAAGAAKGAKAGAKAGAKGAVEAKDSLPPWMKKGK